MRRLWQSHVIALLFAIPSVVTAQQFVDVLIKANDYAYLKSVGQTNAAYAQISAIVTTRRNA
jgi:hypothetical protein